jgi:NADPH:quinone reductase-like Zn-dependent oxidoreductase
MKAITYNRYGPADVLRVGEMPEPRPRQGQLLIEVMASSVNPVDWKIRRGDLRMLIGWRFPRIPGIDFAGVVRQTGPGVTQYKLGDAVFGVLNAARVRLGTSAEYVVADEKQMARKPDGVSFLDAAAIPCAGLTAWHALRDLAGVRVGDHVLINGASGGVGGFGVQIARALGATVTATCSEGNIEFVSALGAEEVVDYRERNVETLPESFDAILDAAATLAYAEVKHLLNPRGVYVTTLPMPDVLISSAWTMLWRGRRAKIVMLNGRQPIPPVLTELGRLVESGKIRANVESIFPLESLADAHRQSETGHARGKIGITIKE